ncbi:unnamed protein product [Didymodactylos carnosus]|uniref:Peptide hydrolase n=1 Tax=Didymodactylos carnosus TaxID=1234261 RepID=A0A8S2END8_9BILA|nr:unnamed protein product [Didymodactylos carnosus]CAF4075267.1 unnamed protein product [Didymodactylos carnosus]
MAERYSKANIKETGSVIDRIKANKLYWILIGFTIVLTIIMIALAAALGTANKKLKANSNSGSTSPIVTSTSSITASTPPSTTSTSPTLPGSIQVNDMMEHLRALQTIADENAGNRAAGEAGFNKTVEYIEDYLNKATNLIVYPEHFPIAQYEMIGTPTLSVDLNPSDTVTYVYLKDFLDMQYASGADWTDGYPLSVIPNLGCSMTDYDEAYPSIIPGKSVALVKRGDCAFVEKSQRAANASVAGLLIYNDGASSDRIEPMTASVDFYTKFPAFFLSSTVGYFLVDAVNKSENISVRMKITVNETINTTIVTNICADTKTGDKSKTIVIGSHTDSVKAGSGINDNGSGTAGTLVLATTLDKLLQRSDYKEYPNRVRFCFWAAEEVGLRGSTYHVEQWHFDMLGSPNYNFGIYNGSSADESIPLIAVPGSIKLTELFTEYFVDNKLPWSSSAFDGRSDYGPFLSAGIACSGVSTGADGEKSQAERDKYASMLPSGQGGIAGMIYDPCYHKECDTVQNIDKYAYEVMVKSAAYVLESIGQNADLVTWLYPSGQSEPTYKNEEFNESFEKSVLAQYHRKTDL